MKRHRLCVLPFLMLYGFYGHGAYCQQTDSLSLELCTQMAIDYSTATAQKNILKSSKQADIKLSNDTYMPSLELNGQASYQSDVTKIPVDVPGVEELSKDQYKASLDFRQVIFDGGYTRKQKQLIDARYAIDQSQLDIDLLKLKDQVSNLYLSLLLIDENMSLMRIKADDLNTQRAKLQAMYANGTALRSNVDIMEAELLKVDQVLIELRVNRQSTIDMVASLIGAALKPDVKLSMPDISVDYSDASNRPEYQLFDAQVASVQSQSLLLNAKNRPKVYLFGTGGYGRPGLDMLYNEFDTYYMAGVKLTMPLTNWTSTRHEKQLALDQKAIILEKKKNFARMNLIQLNKQLSEITKYQQLIVKDQAIIDKRRQIKEAEAMRLENGVSTSNDYIIELNAENQALLNRKLHMIQLIQAKQNYRLLQGK